MWAKVSSVISTNYLNRQATYIDGSLNFSTSKRTLSEQRELFENFRSDNIGILNNASDASKE